MSTEDQPSGPGIATDHLRENLSRRLFGEDSSVPMAIGRYAVVERLGAGASGVVFKAFDEELERMVAIKVLSRDTTENEELRRLALREGKSLARLSHPHVVGIHEVGEERGSLYFVMEFVRGGDLARWIAAQDAKSPEHAGRALSLMLEAGRGLWAAHQAGIVHRDFKPANVLVTEEGRAKVADFGLARAEAEDDAVSRTRESWGVSRESTTQQGVVVGTRAYMAPERWHGAPASEVTDQLAFCVAAWEALCGERPWPTWPWAEGAAPSSPGGVRLDAKVRKALERGLALVPAERWPSVGALLETLSPRPSRLPAIAIGSVVLGLGSAVALAAFRPEERCTGAEAQLSETWSEARAEAIEAEVEALGLPHAGDAWTRFSSDVDAYAHGWASMHRETCEATVIRKEQSEAVMDLRMACLRRAHQALASTVDSIEHPDREVMLRTHRLLAGLPPLRECADVELLQADVRPPEAADEAGVNEARARLADARALVQVAKLDEAAAAMQEAATVARSVDYGPLDVEVSFEQGVLAMNRGEYDEAVSSLRAALASAVRWDRPVLALHAAYELSDAESRLAKHESAQVHADLASAWALRPNMPPEHVMAAHNQQGGMHRVRGETDEALVDFREAERVATEAFGPQHRETSVPLSNVAATLYDKGEYAEAIEAYQRVLEIRVAERGPAHPSTGLAHNALCTVRVGAGKPEQALPDCRLALEIFQQALPAGHADIAMAQTNLGNALFDSGDREEGLAMARAAVRTWIAAVGEEHPDTARGRRSLAHSLATVGKVDDARVEMELALATFERALGEEHPVVAQTRTSLGQLEFEAGQPEKALQMYERNRDALIATMGEDHPAFAVAELARGEALTALGRIDEAREAIELALKIRIARFGEDSEKVARVRESLAKLPTSGK